MKFKIIFVLCFFALAVGCDQPSRDSGSSSSDKGVFFVNLKDGDTIKPVSVIVMGIKGMEVEPSGKISEGKGHHHLIIDGTYVEKGQPIAKDETHIHFGKGQTSDTLSLSPGEHTLTLQFADGMHQSYGPDWSKTIHVFVKNEPPRPKGRGI